ncbi:MAG: bifunctional molybdenum cofactor biosynthesis protein MoaC/MoaB [Ignavibacteriales bacterium]|nr:bifunctional molybdenum cofactor biosynthesis protein MoaC/MoaB [Ignavibacteriales bacterium]
MIDISNKIKTLRIAKAEAMLKLKQETIESIHQNKIPKGNPLEVAKVAATQAAKNTSSIIPYCHPLPIDYVGVEFEFGDGIISVRTTVKAIYKTGVEMEALTAALVAVLTLYDIMKMFDNTMEIVGVKLLEKTGGKSDFKTIYDKPLRAAVLVMSDSIAAGTKSDLSGQLIVEGLKKEGIEVLDYKIIPDDVNQIVQTLIEYTDKDKLDLVMTTGGTGFSSRDCTPEAMLKIIEREIPGIPEATRAYGQERTPYSMLSRAKAGIRGRTLIVNLPGSKKGVTDSLNALFPGLLHSFKMMWGGGH